MANIVQLIYTREFRGDGTKENPCRSVPQLFTLDGKLVAENDSDRPDQRIADIDPLGYIDAARLTRRELRA